MTTQALAVEQTSSKTKLSLRLLLGALYVVFGLNGFFQFLPQPAPTPEGGAFLGALFTAGYMFPFIKITEILGGALLLANRSTLGAVILFPVTLNILAYHLFLDQGGLVIALAFLAMNLGVAWFNRDNYKSLFVKG